VSIHVALNHVTHYRYDRLVALGPQVVRLRPAPHCRTRILSYSLKVTPAQHFINWQQDPEANYLGRFVFPEKARELRIEVDLVAEMAVLNPFDFFLEPYAETFPFAYQGVDKRDLAPYLVMFRGEPLFREYLRHIPRERKRTIDFLVELNAKLAKDIKYLIRMEPGVQTPELTLTKRSGSCRDSAWLMVQLLRHMGLAARFVSGYLIQLTADMSRSTARRDPRRISPTCTPGARSIYPAPGGSASIPPRGCSRARATSRWPARRSRAPRRR
jgi:transglutaminase-like putative cysteine protease